MKRPKSLLIGLFLVLFGTELTFAQNENHKGFAEKTRYVYLWDVTGSTRGSLYDKMAEFLKSDLLDKQDKNGSEVYLVPFNDGVLLDACENFVIGSSDDKYIDPVGGNISQIDDLVKKGSEMAYSHNDYYNEFLLKKEQAGMKNFVPTDEDKGFTNIAAAVKYASEKFIDNDVNTIFILLTDGGQEYFEDGSKGDGSTPEAKKWLREELQNIDNAMVAQTQSLNKLFYIIFPNNKKTDDPRGENKEYLQNLTNTEFIDNQGSSLKIYLKGITMCGVNEGSAPNTRDTKFNLRFEGVDKKMIGSLDVHINVAIEDEYGNEVYAKKLPLDCNNNCIEVKCGRLPEGIYTVYCQQPDSEQLNKKAPKNTFIGIWLENNTSTFVVEDNFKPTVTIKIEK